MNFSLLVLTILFRLYLPYDNLHDKFAKDRLQNEQNAIDFLRLALPQDIFNILSIETITSTQS